jgi:hypothetical protein
MNRRIVRLVEDLRRTRFAELAGSRVAADLAVPEALINRALAELFADETGKSRGPVRGARVQVEPGNRFHVDLELGRLFMPSLGVDVVIERQPKLPGSPMLVLKWRSLPGLTMLAGMAGPFLPTLPPGVRLEGEQVFLDLRPLLARAGASDLLPLLSELRISTRAGAVDIHLSALAGGG